MNLNICHNHIVFSPISVVPCDLYRVCKKGNKFRYFRHNNFT